MDFFEEREEGIYLCGLVGGCGVGGGVQKVRGGRSGVDCLVQRCVEEIRCHPGRSGDSIVREGKGFFVVDCVWFCVTLGVSRGGVGRVVV